MAYSKRALLSAYQAEIQSDRDLSGKQDLVLIETTRQGRMPIVEDAAGTTIYTDYTLAAYAELKPLIASGAERFRLDNHFLKKEEFLDCLDGFHQVLAGQSAKKVMEERQTRYPHLALSSGYMHQKTNLVKE